MAAYYDAWVDKPADPDDLVTKKRRVPRAMVIGKSLNFVTITEALNRGVPTKFQITWQELTRFNWRTDVPAEVNWYLWLYLGPHVRPTHDRHNYRFKGDPADLGVDYAKPIHPSQFIWVPEYDPPPPTRRIAAERKKKIVIDQQSCPYRDKGKTECTRTAWPGGVRLMCSADLSSISRSPAKRDPEHYVELESTTPDQKVAAETQQVKQVYLQVFRWLVHRVVTSGSNGGLPVFAAKPVERITQVVIDFQGVLGRGVDSSTAKKFSSSDPRPVSIERLPGHVLRSGQGAQELGAAAKTIRDLFAVGMLSSIVLRAYEDRLTPRTMLERELFTQQRADWVFNTLCSGFLLPIVKHEEGATGAAAEVAALLSAGAIPVVVKGCGAGDATGGVRDERYRVAIIEYATRAPRPPTVSETQLVLQWDEYENVANGEAKKRTIVHSGRSNAVARDAATLESFRNELWPYLVLLSDVDEKLTKEPIKEVRREVSGWDASTAAEAEALFGNTQKLTPCYWEPNKKASGGYSIGEEPVVVSKIWLGSDASAEPNHLRVLEQYSSCSASPDVMRHVELLVGTKYKTHNRIHFE